jgi:hypothetical protein
MSKITVYVRHAPIGEEIFWCIAMILAIALSLAVMIALWRFGSIGGFVIGFLCCYLMRK